LGGNDLGGERSGGKCSGKGQSDGDAKDGGMPGQQRINHEISIGERALANRIGDVGIERPKSFSQRENDLFAARPQGR
jgi:hypothetical protein